MKQLETSRLYLQNWKLTDSAALFEYAKQPIVGQQAGWKPHETEQESYETIKWFQATKEIWALAYKANQKIIGSIGLHNRYPMNNLITANLRQAEIGYVLHPDYWGQGLIPEAKQRVLEYAFSTVNVDLIWCGHFEDNYQAKRVSHKCGLEFQFQQQKKLEKLGNKEVLIDYYLITKEQFFQRNGYS